MKVGFISDTLFEQEKVRAGGAEIHTWQLICYAMEIGVQAVAYVPGVGADCVVEGLDVHMVEGTGKAFWQNAARRALAEGCAGLHFQYLERVPEILGSPTVSASFHGIFWDILFEKRMSHWYPHGSIDRFALPLWRYLEMGRTLRNVRRVNAVLAGDSGLLRLVQATMPSQRIKLFVTGNFNDLATAATGGSIGSELEEREASAPFRVLMPRNISLSKGGGWIGDLAAELDREITGEWELAVAGAPLWQYGNAGRYQQALDRDLECRARRARDRVTLLGSIEHDKMLAVYRSADVVIIPTFAYEGASIAVIEASYSGRPVVATNVGGLNDVVIDGVNGLLSPPDPKSMARLVGKLYRDGDYRRRLGTNGMMIAREGWSLEAWRLRLDRFAVAVGWRDAAA